jgi:CBS domain-containing protein
MIQPLLVSEFASPSTVTVTLEDSLEHAYRVILEHRISAVLVVGAAGKAAGVLSRRDLLEVGRVTARVRNRPSGLALPVQGCGDLMSRPVIHVSRDAAVTEAARLMIDRKVHRVFVLDEDGKPTGVFSSRDAMAAVRAARLDTPIAAVASSPVVSISIHHTLAEAGAALEQAGVAGAIVVDDDGLPVGTFGEAEQLVGRDLPAGTRVEDVMEPSLLLLPGRTPLFRAASFAMSTTARRIGVVDGHHHVHGIVTGMDFCRALAASTPEPIRGVAAGT